MEQKPKIAVWKKVLIGIVASFFGILILSKLFPINYYETGIDKYNKKEFKEALEDLSKVEPTDKNYTSAIAKITEIKPIVDSIINAENIEKAKQEKVKTEITEKREETKETVKEPVSETVTDVEENNAVNVKKNISEEGLKGTVGQSYEVGTLTYKVERVKFKKFIGGLYTLNKADGIFVIISLTATNKSKKTINIDNSYFKLTDESGAEYEYSPDATATLEISQFPGETFMGMSLNPNVAKKGKVVFEVPSKNKNYKLIFTDPFSGTFLEINMN